MIPLTIPVEEPITSTCHECGYTVISMDLLEAVGMMNWHMGSKHMGGKR